MEQELSQLRTQFATFVPDQKENEKAKDKEIMGLCILCAKTQGLRVGDDPPTLHQLKNI